MKLKKIASLMLAGIMAVSMLAGCKSSNNGNNVPSDSEPINPATGVSADFESYLSEAADRNITMSDDSDLNANFQRLVELNVTEGEAVAVYDQGIVNHANLSIALAGTEYMDCEDALSDLRTLANNDTDNDKEKTAVRVFTISGGVNEKTALRIVAAQVDNAIANLPAASANGEYEYTYTGSVSIVNKSGVNNEGTTRNAWIIAVSVSRTPSKV